MSRPVRTIKPETSLETIMENMRQLGVLCLPVVDQQGKVQGLVAEVNIFKALLKLKSSPNISTSGEVRQEHPAFPHPPHCSRTQPTRTMETSLLYSSWLDLQKIVVSLFHSDCLAWWQLKFWLLAYKKRISPDNRLWIWQKLSRIHKARIDDQFGTSQMS